MIDCDDKTLRCFCSAQIFFSLRFFLHTAAVALEKKNQRATFRKQRDDYKRRATALKRELKILKGQREELVSGSQPPSPTTNGFLKENDRLQVNTNWPNRFL